MLRRLCNVCAGLAVVAAAAVGRAQPVVIEEILRAGPDNVGPIRGLLATVDLTDPTVEILTTAPTGTATEAVLTRTDTWRTSVGAKIAINANFYSIISGSNADVIGLAFANGVQVSPFRQFGAFPDPAITFDQNRVPTVGYISNTAGVWDAVAGVGPSNTDSDPGTLLITDGVNTGATARVTPATREPRTAVGINQAGTRLYMLVIDGRQSTWSVGVTLAELADLLLERGVWRAVNLDGGGSSSFVYTDDLGTVRTNKPSDGSMRSVAYHLGIKINNPAPILERTVRPMRGIWMRPPGASTSFPNTPNYTSLESVLAVIAPAGIQDLFLETFFWGRTTNNSSVYNDRYSTDYLAEAIVRAAKYGMRVHAWCEVAYQSFGTSGSYLFNANPATNGDQNGRAGSPEWPVVFAPGTVPTTAGITAGDQVNQTFVNPIHPGVRARLNEYMAELAGYPGLAGINIDYIRFPLDPNTGDAYTAPWSYDTWTRAAFAADGFGDPVATALQPTGPNSGQWSSYVTWRKAGISEAVSQMFQAMQAVNSGMVFSGAIFPDPNSSAQLTKMQDWPTWAANYAFPLISPMCYSSTQTSIRNELNAALTNAGTRRVAAALAYPATTGHPDVSTQLAAITGASRRVEEFIWFDTTSFDGASAPDTTNRSQLQTWLTNSATQLQGDCTATGAANGFDGRIDARDWAWFNTVYTGTPVARTTANDRCDLNRDSTINATDRALLDRAFRRFICGYDDVVDARDLQALRNCFTNSPAPVAGILNLYDITGDNKVDYLDEVRLNGWLTRFIGHDTDVNRDGRVDFEDVPAQCRAPIDVNRNGTVADTGDLPAEEVAVRGAEASTMKGAQR